MRMRRITLWRILRLVLSVFLLSLVFLFPSRSIRSQSKLEGRALLVRLALLEARVEALEQALQQFVVAAEPAGPKTTKISQAVNTQADEATLPEGTVRARVITRSNVRTGPGLEHPIIRVADVGESLLLVGSGQTGAERWYRIYGSGWIAEFLLEPFDATQLPFIPTFNPQIPTSTPFPTPPPVTIAPVVTQAPPAPVLPATAVVPPIPLPPTPLPPTPLPPTLPATAVVAPATAASTYSQSAGQSQACLIKGNISYKTGTRYYFVPGHDFYERTKINTDYGERWFCSEAEAQAAGWQRAFD